MASVGKPCQSAGKESRGSERSAQDKKQGKVLEECQSSMNEEQCTTVKAEDIPALAIRPEHLEKVQLSCHTQLRAPQPPKDSPKPRAMSRVLVRKTRPPDDHSTGARVAMAKLLPKSAVPQPLDYTDPGGPRFDAKGMVLPHSILGSLEDFRKEMEARGEVEFVKRIPDLKEQQDLEFGGQKLDDRTRSRPEHQQDQQRHALEHWHYHMAERRRQQNFISNLLQKPVEDLLMNQANRFRETQEQRELISRGLPALYNGHGAGVGSEFWSAPQRYGDELSGIMATLTQKERGNMKPMTHITQPQSTRLETGNVLSERPVTRAWSHSQYLKHRQNELRNVLSDLDFNQPEMDGLEIVGSSQPFTSDSVEECKKQEQNEEDGSEAEHKENEDPLAIFDDVMLGVELLPAMRISGELARWNGSTTSNQDEVGVSVYMTFESVVGESTCSHLELRNDGSTAIYYSWQKLELPQSFPEARTHVNTQEFYFNTATAVILPGDIERIQFIFKPVCPGIVTEVWKLHTHPVLLGGAMFQVTLKGRALYQDKTAKQRTALELELEQRVAESVCRSVLIELLHGIHTPERPGSPDELYSTEDEQFNAHNPNLYFHHEPVEALKGLWEQANWTKVNKLGGTRYEYTHWDLCMSSLYQVVISLPLRDGDTLKEQPGLCREEALSRYNSLLLQLHQPQHVPVPLTLHEIGLQLWRELVDGVGSEALRLRHVLGLPENVNWGDPHHETDILETPAKDEAAAMIKEKEEKKSAARPPAKEEHGRSKKKPKVDEESLEKELNTNASSTTESAQQHDDMMMRELQQRYRHTIHRQVYVLVENMIDSLGDLFEEAQQIQENLNKST